jgi:hypothetical protein
MSNSGDRSIETLDLEITINYVLPPTTQTTERRAKQATIANAGNLAIQALTMPGNLTDDGAGSPVATNIVSGLLTGPGGLGRPSAVYAYEWDTLTATTTIAASAVVVVTQPTS